MIDVEATIAPHWTTRAAQIVVPRRRDDVNEEAVDGEAILFDSRSGSTHRLNQTAYIVWRCCDGGTTTREMADQFTEIYSIEFDTALDRVEQLVAAFVESDLLEATSK